MTRRGTVLQIIAMNNKHNHPLETAEWNQDVEIEVVCSEVKCIFSIQYTNFV